MSALLVASVVCFVASGLVLLVGHIRQKRSRAQALHYVNLQITRRAVISAW